MQAATGHHEIGSGQSHLQSKSDQSDIDNKFNVLESQNSYTFRP